MGYELLLILSTVLGYKEKKKDRDIISKKLTIGMLLF
jgi:hypothetical protein